jgi:hypothetical protein
MAGSLDSVADGVSRGGNAGGVPARVTRSLHTVLPSSFTVEPTPRSNALRIIHPFRKRPVCEV